MKKFYAFLILTLLLASNVLANGVNVFPIEISPLQPGNENPEVRMIDRELSVDGINPYNYRTGQYAFTGETITYRVIVRDLNGASDIAMAAWVVEDLDESFCNIISNPQSEFGSGWQNYIQTRTGWTYSSSTDKLYKCILTVKPSWSGSKNIYVKATDMGGGTGITQFETFVFNPSVTLSVTTTDGQPLSFGEMDNNRVSYSTNKVKISSPQNSVVDMWVFFAGSDFVATQGTALCPTSNVLSIDNFEYRAISGTVDSGWKKVPLYKENDACDINKCRNGDPVPERDFRLSANQHIEIAIRVRFPIPCIGTFDKGTFYAVAKAV
ncbi:MAG: hypothetical protein QW480_01870 [Candidatus Aenigmatarchaeota archaeon]